MNYVDILKERFHFRNTTRNIIAPSGAALDSLWRLTKLILDSLEFEKTVQKIVDGVLTELDYFRLGYRIIVLSLPDYENNVLKRVSASQTEQAKKALSAINMQLQNIIIPLSEKDNLLVRTFNENKIYMTHDWYDILRPAVSREEAGLSQKAAGIKTSMIFPVVYHQKPAGVMIFSMIKEESEVTDSEKDMIRSFTDVVGLAVQNARLYTSVEQTTNELQELNSKLKRANDQLQELDKLKDEFVSLASHELRTPMTAIKGSLSTILEGYAGDISSQAKEFLAAAYNENDRLLRLVNNLLNISRIEAGRMNYTIGNMDMDKVIAEVVTNLGNVANEKSLFLKYEHDGPLPYVEADSDKVREILFNIIGNALKFTHKGGVTVKVHFDGTMVVTSITDTGSGITKEDQDLLFKKFSQVQQKNYARPQGGTGLGLYICRIMVEDMKGKIWLESTQGVGSTFYFSLPISS